MAVASQGEPYWHLLFTQAGRELEAATHLANQSIETLLLQFLIRKPNGFKRFRPQFKDVAVPVFPRYVFAFYADDCRSVSSTRGVHSIVHFGEVPAYVHECVIFDLRSRIGSDGYIALVDSLPPAECPFVRGDGVRVHSGPFQGLTGLFDARIKGKDRARLLLHSVFNAQRYAEVGLADIEFLTWADA